MVKARAWNTDLILTKLEWVDGLRRPCGQHGTSRRHSCCGGFRPRVPNDGRDGARVRPLALRANDDWLLYNIWIHLLSLTMPPTVIILPDDAPHGRAARARP
jgi:hypothetical protein